MKIAPPMKKREERTIAEKPLNTKAKAKSYRYTTL